MFDPDQLTPTWKLEYQLGIITKETLHQYVASGTMFITTKGYKEITGKTMWKHLMHNLWRNEKYTVIGIVMIALGLVLWSDHHYFFWPPQYAGIMNDDGLDAIAVVLGIGLVIYAAKNIHDNLIAGILLSGSAGFVSLITVIEIVHFAFAGFESMKLTLILSLYLLARILILARNRNTRT